MDLRLLWSLAETGFSLAAIAAMAISWSIWQRAERGRETVLLCGSVLALAAFYGCHAADAAIHASNTAEMPYTVWVAFGQTALVIVGILFSAFLLTVVTRLYAPSRPDGWLVWAIVVPVSIAGVLALSGLGRLLWSLVVGQDTDLLATDVQRIVGRTGSLVTLCCFAVPISFFDALFAAVPTLQRARWVRWLTEGGSWQAVAHRETAGSDLQPSPRATRRFRRAALLFLYVAWALNMPVVQDLQGSSSLAIVLPVLMRLSLLPSLLALVYYHARFVFFHTFVTRGAVAGLVAVGVTTTVFLVEALAEWSTHGTWLAAISVATTMLLLTSGRVIHRAHQWVDRLVFGRPDYRRALASTTAAMAACPTIEDLAMVVTARLADTLGATGVRWGAEPRADAEVVVGLGPPGRVRGYLQLAPRRRGQPYTSEDLTFVEAVAAHMGSLLEGFDARESTRLATIAELKALRAQINPHFLFNALTTLAEMARGQPDTERTILNLSRVFRHALDATQHELVPLRDEIEAVRAYLEIEAERFEKQLRFEIAVPEDVYETPIPPMLLQPLVENAVKHGLSPRVSGGVVRVTAVRDDGHLRVTVQDDGIGFDLDGTPRRIGLTNVGARVERTGGWCRVQSIPGAGTQVTLALVTP